MKFDEYVNSVGLERLSDFLDDLPDTAIIN